MGNFGTKPKPKADTNVPKRPSGNIHCTLSPSPSPTHTHIHLSMLLAPCLSAPLSYICLCLCLCISLCTSSSCVCLCVCAVSYYIRALVTCHLPLGRRVGGAVKASVLKGPVSVLST